MHEQLVKVARMRLKSEFSAKVVALWCMGNGFVPSPL